MHLYCSKNKKSGNFGKITTEIFTKDEIIELYSISVKEAQDNEKIFLKELEIYCLGTLDTETGVIVPEQTYILDVATLLVGGDSDVRKEEVEQSVLL